MSDLDAVHRGQSFLDSLAEKMVIHEQLADGVTGHGEISDTDRLALLAELSPIEYDRQRDAAAKAMNIRSSTLDKMVKELRQEKSSTEGIDFDDVEPWPNPVEPAALLSDLANVVRRFIVCPDETAHAAALWIAMTWFMDVVQVAPLAVITAPEKRCGKSQLLFLLGRLVHRPLAASNITAAALFRAVDAWKPTWLVDEADAFMKDNEELRGLLNCGHTRDSAYIVRVVGDDHTPKRFNVWGAKALAGIGHLADTIMDRSIVLELRRKLPHEEVLRLRYAEPGLFDDLSARLARFATDTRERLRRCRPDLPNALHDRAQDNWEPLLAIAEMAGGEWPQMARDAALKLSGSTEDGGTMGNELLADIREIVESKRLAKISTADLIAALCDDDEKSWATYNRGRPITPRQVAKKLKEYGIASKNLRINYEVVKGFEHEQFKEAFARYLALSPEMPLHRYKSPEASNHTGLDVADDSLRSGIENQDATPKPAPIQGCSGVADISEGEPESTLIEVEI
jgi:putative DNA primase/helicase